MSGSTRKRAAMRAAVAGIVFLSARGAAGQSIGFTSVTATQVYATTYSVRVDFDGANGQDGCYSGAGYCYPYNYNPNVNSFAISVNGVSQKAAFTVTKTTPACTPHTGEWSCYTAYKATGTVTLPRGVTSALLTSIAFNDGTSGTSSATQYVKQCGPVVTITGRPSDPYAQRKGSFSLALSSLDVPTGGACPEVPIDRASFRFTVNGTDRSGQFVVASDGSTAMGSAVLLALGTANAFVATIDAVAPGGSRLTTTSSFSLQNTAQACRPGLIFTTSPPNGTTSATGAFTVSYSMIDPNVSATTPCTDGSIDPMTFLFDINGSNRSGFTASASQAAASNVPLLSNQANIAHASVQGLDATGARTIGAASLSVAVSGTQALAAPWIVADTVRAGRTIVKDLCLTIAVGSGAANECGALRLAHAMPSLRTMGRRRTPTLIYNSAHAQPYVTLTASVTGLGAATPDSVVVDAWIAPAGSVPKTVGQHARASFVGAAFSTGTARRVAVGMDRSADATGLYAYTLEAHAWLGGQQSDVGTASDEVAVVNRGCQGCSPFGAGWWLAGLERVVRVDADRLLWVEGDGSTRLYRRMAASSRYFRTAFVDRPDSLADTTLATGGAGFVRYGPTGLRIVFDAYGYQVATVNRLGHSTDFAYTGMGSATLLSTVTLQAAGVSSRPYFALHYTPHADGQAYLDEVRAVPASGLARIASVGVDAQGFLSTITDPDATGDAFVPFDVAHKLIGRRADVHLTRPGQYFDYADNRSLRGTWEPFLVSASAPATCWSGAPTTFGSCIRFSDASLAGLGSATALVLSASDDSLSTAVDGPRPAVVGDTSRYWLNGYGAPYRIRNALGYASVLEFGDDRFPGLVTRLTRMNGFVSTAHYDARGNVDVATDVDPLDKGAGHDQETRYEYDTKWDFPVRIAAPGALVRRVHYVAANGNLDWEQPGELGVGDTLRTSYEYSTTYSQPQAVVLPSQKRTSYLHNTLGNDSTVTTSRGYVVLTQENGFGEPLTVRTQIDTARIGGVRWQTSTAEFDVMGRAWHTQQTGDDMAGAGAITLLDVQSTFDDDGRLASVTRRSLPDNAQVGPLLTSSRYDYAGHIVAQVATDGKVDSTVYDEAGNPDTVITRRGHMITMEYSSLNQLNVRRVPAVAYASEVKGVAAYRTNVNTPIRAANKPYPRYDLSEATPLQIAADAEVFTYNDTTGAMLEADNGDALVSRTYFPNGALKTERQRLRTVSGVDFTKHDYTLTYNYDDAGRLVRLDHPAILGFQRPGMTSAPNFTAYAFEPITGALQTVSDTSASIHFDYDRNGRVSFLKRGLYVNESFGYDDDGQLATDRIWGRNESAPRLLPAGNQRNATFLYDARVKLLQSRNDAGLRDQLDLQYSGAGQLTSSVYAATPTNGNPVAGSAGESYIPDAFGNSVTGNKSVGGKVTSVCCVMGGNPGTSNNYALIWAYRSDGTGRIESLSGGPGAVGGSDGKKLYYYDDAGNTSFTTRMGQSGDDAASYYDAQNRLRAIDVRMGGNPSLSSAVSLWNFTFDEYRYDALGRRVLSRSRHDCFGPNSSLPVECEQSFVQRTVWNRSSELYEMHMPGDFDLPASALENDTLVTPNPPVRFLSGYNYYRTALYGRVSYAFGLQVDRPVFVRRHAYGELEDGQPARFFETLVWYPHWNTRGEVDGASELDGGASPCTGTGASQRCVSLQRWPATYTPYKQLSFTRYTWQGSLLEDRKDHTGLIYLRNRYLDPHSGRFTQEDPIGLAGGMNAYGFASGDPINYSDPFGLYIVPIQDAGLRATLARMLQSPTFAKIWYAMALAPANKATYAIEVTDGKGVMKFSGGSNGTGHTLCTGTRCLSKINEIVTGSIDVIADEFTHAAAGVDPSVSRRARVPRACAAHGGNYNAAGCGDIRTRIFNETPPEEPKAPSREKQ